jgi:hypothetical protein
MNLDFVVARWLSEGESLMSVLLSLSGMPTVYPIDTHPVNGGDEYVRACRMA